MDNNFINGTNEQNIKPRAKHDKVCKNCGRRILYNSDPNVELCPMCKDQELFYEVKDYIRANDVKDYDVAEHFGIPLSKVKDWIKQGRIQYKESPEVKGIMANYCNVCGKATSFGTICQECLKEKRRKERKGLGLGGAGGVDHNKMQFIEENK